MGIPEIIFVWNETSVCKDERHFVSDTRQRFSLYRECKFYCFSGRNIRNLYADRTACPWSVMRIEINLFLRVRVFVTSINVLFKLPGMFKVKDNGKII
jgi:hypothetical protein